MTEKHPEPSAPAEGAETALRFETLFDHEILAAIRDLGWQVPNAVQVKTIPLMLAGKDLIVQARTGSGKTGAFGLPIVAKIDPGKPTTQALIMLPTRELANQVANELRIMGKHRGVRCVPIYGGVGYQEQLDGIKAGAHIVAGTPGRILDHVGKGALHFRDLAVLIMDEADELLSQGFWPDMKELHSLLPAKRQSCLFSATMPERVRSLARVFLSEPEHVRLSEGQLAPAQIRHAFVIARATEKDSTLLRILEAEEPESAIIFANTKDDVRYVTTYLQRRGWDAEQISGDLSQAEREKAMANIKAGKLRLLVATDVAARGIDISDLSHVISYSAPNSPEVYVHRTGRTGRAGKEGAAISIISGLDIGNFRQMQLVNKMEIAEYKLPTEADLAKLIAGKLAIKIEQELRAMPEKEREERMERFRPVIEMMGSTPEGRRDLAAICSTFLSEHRPVTTVDEKPELAKERKTELGGEARQQPSTRPAGERGQRKGRRGKPRGGGRGGSRSRS